MYTNSRNAEARSTTVATPAEQAELEQLLAKLTPLVQLNKLFTIGVKSVVAYLVSEGVSVAELHRAAELQALISAEEILREENIPGPDELVIRIAKGFVVRGVNYLLKKYIPEV